jgi:hypothetical protein
MVARRPAENGNARHQAVFLLHQVTISEEPLDALQG